MKGLQGNHSRYVRANAGCKHFDAHGGPENIPSDRMKFNSVVRTDLFIVAEDVCNVKT